MDTTTSSFTLRKNAKRAAEAMISKGTAPAVGYGIKPSGDGRFKIVWKTATTALTTDEVETEIAEASTDRPAAALPTEAAPQSAPVATERAMTDAAPYPVSEAEAASKPGATGQRARPGIERPVAEKRMGTRHPRYGAQNANHGMRRR